MRNLVRPADRAADIVAFEESVIAFFIESAALLGIPKSVAAIYGLCFASADPLSFSDINARLNISSGSISQGLRLLKGVGALKVAEPVGSMGVVVAMQDREGIPRPLARQRERYEPDLHLRNLAARWIKERLGTQLDIGRAQLADILQRLPAANGERRVLRDRLKHLQNWRDQAGALLPMMINFLKST